MHRHGGLPLLFAIGFILALEELSKHDLQLIELSLPIRPELPTIVFLHLYIHFSFQQLRSQLLVNFEFLGNIGKTKLLLKRFNIFFVFLSLPDLFIFIVVYDILYIFTSMT